MQLYYIEKPFFYGCHAGVKPKNDLNTQLRTMGFKPISNEINLNSNDLVFFYYPFNYDWEQVIFDRLSGSHIQIIIFILEIRSITCPDENLENELEIYNQASYLIVHNEKMKQWLIEKGVLRSMFCLELFDYFVKEQIYEQIPPRHYGNEVVFAGCLHPNLRKFLYDQNYQHDYQLNVYGPDLEGEINNSNQTYLGIYTPEVIPAYLKGSFGLHWNGDSKDTCSGAVAQYSKIATSHKISLYLIAKLPIISWEHSSEAEFIGENMLGFLISNLDEIDVKLRDVTEKDYQEMLQNVSKYSVRLKEGYYYKRVINEVLIQIKENYLKGQ